MQGTTDKTEISNKIRRLLPIGKKIRNMKRATCSTGFVMLDVFFRVLINSIDADIGVRLLAL